VAVSRQQGTQVDLAELIALRDEARWLQLTPRGRVLATRSGGHLSRFRGRGMEFDESRVYQPGDDIRNMDWRVTARAGRPHVKLFREERERPIWLAVDLGPSMRFGTRVAFKSVVAARAAALLSWAATDQGDRIGGLVFDEQRHAEQRPVARNRGALAMLRLLCQPATGASGTGHAGILGAAEYLLNLVRPGSLVFLLSDFADLTEHRTAWLARLAADNEVVLAQIFDPLEQTPPPAGSYPVTDGQRFGMIDTAAGHGAVWRGLFATRQRLLADLALRYRAHHLMLRTDQPVGPALLQGLQARVGGTGAVR